MKNHPIGTRLVLVLLAALLALPMAPTASPVEAKKRSRTITRTFRNVVPINLPGGSNLPSPVSAGFYPSDIPVAGLKGTIRDVNVRLNGLSHTHPRDVEVLLVGPGGQTAVVMANVGLSGDVSNVTLTLDDEAASPLPGTATLQSGTFRPTHLNGGAITFNAPAPSAGANAALSVFDGGGPNGPWRLFVQDEFGPEDSGMVAGGWDIEFQTQFKVKKKKRR